MRRLEFQVERCNRPVYACLTGLIVFKNEGLSVTAPSVPPFLSPPTRAIVK
jgi:hypothetical protein